MSLYQAKRYLGYRLHAGNEHSVHSPFVFDLYTQAIDQRCPAEISQPIERERKRLLADNSILPMLDLGAGGLQQAEYQTTVSHFARRTLKSPKYAGLLYRIARYLNPETTVELGTSLGITSAYLSRASGRLHTIEGAPEVARHAQQVFNNLDLPHITLHQGNFDDAFPVLLKDINRVDMLYIDGNHRLEPTLRYMEWVRPYLHEHSVVILDDIHWSAEMEQAWEQVKQLPQVTITIDLFFIGLVFFRKGIRRQDFRLRY